MWSCLQHLVFWTTSKWHVIARCRTECLLRFCISIFEVVLLVDPRNHTAYLLQKWRYRYQSRVAPVQLWMITLEAAQSRGSCLWKECHAAGITDRSCSRGWLLFLLGRIITANESPDCTQGQKVCAAEPLWALRDGLRTSTVQGLWHLSACVCSFEGFNGLSEHQWWKVCPLWRWERGVPRFQCFSGMRWKLYVPLISLEHTMELWGLRAMSPPVDVFGALSKKTSFNPPDFHSS